jgi:sulfatase-like protein
VPAPIFTVPAPIRRLGSVTLTVLAAVLVVVVLVIPDAIVRPKAGAFVPGALLRLPLEGILGAAVLLAVPDRWRGRVAGLLGAGLGVLAVLKVADMGFRAVLGRKFVPVLDWPLFRDGYHALTETNGRTTANAAAAVAALLVLAVPVVTTLAVRRLARQTAAYEQPARRSLVLFSVAWLAFSSTGAALYPNARVASDTAATFLEATALEVPAALRDQRTFAAAARDDPFADVPADQLVAGLRGKDVVIGVVESYGRSAIETPRMSGIVLPVLAAGDKQLAAAGFHARSGFLTSSTYSGGSWLAHSTFQSGLWIDNQQRYRQLAASDRLTFTRAFHQAGWQTVGMEPGNTVAWPEASFYGYDSVYDSRNLGYQGPRFGWSRMPDQYTLAQFQRRVYGRPHPPTLAELTLTSSHEPWTPVPARIGWDQVGDGSVYRSMVQGSVPRQVLWSNAAKTQTAYATSVAYSVGTLVDWVQKYGDDNLVLVMFGDHQPMPLVSGRHTTHDVPVTVIAHDPKVLDRIAGWGWQDGLRPRPDAPVWPMDAFRDKFFAAFRQPGETTR